MQRTKGFVILVALIALCGAAVRWHLLTTSQVGFLNADEAYAGIQARRIAEGDRPVILRGIGYTAPVDGYVLAPFMTLIGGSVAALKVIASLWYALTAVVVAALLGRVRQHLHISTATVVAAASAMWILPGAMMTLSLRSYMAYGSLPLVSALLLWSAIEASHNEVNGKRSALVGGLAGFLFYLHPMMIAPAVAMLLTPTWTHRRSITKWWVPVASAALAVNVPLLVYNARNHWPTFTPPPGNGNYLGRLWGIVSELWPRSFGVMTTDGAWTYNGAGLIFYLVLLSIAAVGMAHLATCGPAGRTVAVTAAGIWPLFSALSSSAFVTDGRYTTVGYVPFVIVIAVGAERSIMFLTRLFPAPHRAAQVLCVALSASWIGVLGIGWWARDAGQQVDDPNARLRHAAQVIASADINHVAGNFWHVLPIEYLSGGDIHASVAGHPWGAYLEWRPHLPWAVMFPERQQEVAAQPDHLVAYAFEIGDEQTGVLRRPATHYERVAIGSTVLYLPAWNE